MKRASAERLARDGAAWNDTTIAREAWRKAREQPDAVAIFLENEPDATYAALAHEARCLIAGLQQLGLRAGDVVSFQLPNWREAVPIDIAAAALGLVVNPIVPIYRDAELSYILRDAATRVFFIPEKFRSIDYVGMALNLAADLPDPMHIVTVRAQADYKQVLRFEKLVDQPPVALEELPVVDPDSVKARLHTIAARGPGMFLGYADAEQNAQAHTADGYFLTGDIGHITPDGAVLITDRNKDIFIRGGENLSAKEIEDALHHHPSIREAAVVSMPHKRLGEGVFAFLILDSDEAELSQDEVAAFTDQQGLARQKIPERIAVMNDLPRTPSGKVRKDVLRNQLRENA